MSPRSSEKQCFRWLHIVDVDIVSDLSQSFGTATVECNLLAVLPPLVALNFEANSLLSTVVAIVCDGRRSGHESALANSVSVSVSSTPVIATDSIFDN